MTVSQVDHRDVAVAEEKEGTALHGRHLIAGALLIVAAYATLLLPGHLVDDLVEEDAWFEWAGALGLFAAAVLFFAAFLRARRGVSTGRAGRLAPWVLLVLAVVMLGAGGEEISWGQRLFGWGTPADIAHVNVQDETNLHNLKELQNGVFDLQRLFRIAWLVLFALVPIVAAVWTRGRLWLSRWLPLAPLWLAVLFLFNYVASEAAERALNGSSAYTSTYSAGHATQEIQEAIAEVAIGVAAYFAWRAWRRRTASR